MYLIIFIIQRNFHVLNVFIIKLKINYIIARNSIQTLFLMLKSLLNVRGVIIFKVIKDFQFHFLIAP